MSTWTINVYYSPIAIGQDGIVDIDFDQTSGIFMGSVTFPRGFYPLSNL